MFWYELMQETHPDFVKVVDQVCKGAEKASCVREVQQKLGLTSFLLIYQLDYVMYELIPAYFRREGTGQRLPVSVVDKEIHDQSKLP